MGKAARKVASAGQSFLGATVSFYAPNAKVDQMLAQLEKAGVRAKFNARTRGWEAQASMLNFKDKAVNDAIAEYGAFSENFRAARQEKASGAADLKAAVEAGPKLAKTSFTISVVENGKERPIRSGDLETAPRRSVPMAESDVTTYAGRQAWAKEQGREFLAAYVLYGMSLAGERAPERRAQQMAQLKAAPTEDIREVANRNSQRYGELAAKEDRVRFEYVVAHDAFWKEKAEGKKDPEGREEVFQEFARLDHHEKRELATVGRKTPIGLSEADRGLMVSLSNGWRAMQQEYFDRTNERFAQGIVTAATRRNSVIDASAGSLRSVVAETSSIEGKKAAERIRDAVDREQ
ncbi:MAG TPA: hypothetical protein P5256_00925 [Beijerinckiaceae bacterium]|nr:hypothetical protein [Rhodoblastus sp.]MCB1533373.1 hypothetical protein [Rhodoblastus sp.]MCC2106094.1 hypothetical protein [Hyphomicrobiales bacterium]HPG04840.1 hypothetical protein [Rhodoblastus sp.]HRY01657.1 hypothetical protein [Beijerinckiaceae bacterium]